MRVKFLYALGISLDITIRFLYNIDTYKYVNMKETLKIFKALCDETRLKIVESLLKGERCVCKIVSSTKRTQPTVSIQLAKLENLGIVKPRREGKSVYYKLTNPKVKKILKIVKDD